MLGRYPLASAIATSCHCTMPEPGVFLKLQFQSLAAERGTTAYKPMASVPIHCFTLPKARQLLLWSRDSLMGRVRRFRKFCWWSFLGFAFWKEISLYKSTTALWQRLLGFLPPAYFYCKATLVGTGRQLPPSYFNHLSSSHNHLFQYKNGVSVRKSSE